MGLHKSSSIYKIGNSFMAFLLKTYFLLVMATICGFYRYCDLMADTSDTFDTFLGPLAFL